MAQDTKTPTIEFTPSAPTATVGQESFNTPTVQITVGGHVPASSSGLVIRLKAVPILKPRMGKRMSSTT